MISIAYGEALLIILDISHAPKLGNVAPICTAIRYPSCQLEGGFPKTAHNLYN